MAHSCFSTSEDHTSLVDKAGRKLATWLQRLLTKIRIYFIHDKDKQLLKEVLWSGPQYVHPHVKNWGQSKRVKTKARSTCVIGKEANVKTCSQAHSHGSTYLSSHITSLKFRKLHSSSTKHHRLATYRHIECGRDKEGDNIQLESPLLQSVMVASHPLIDLLLESLKFEVTVNTDTGTAAAPDNSVTSTVVTPVPPETDDVVQPGNQPVSVSVAPIHKKKSWKEDERAGPSQGEEEEELINKTETTRSLSLSEL
ncbi:hypothetical protein QYF61_017777 [Mycteria americana]|uniref:Uncharacterized protein n=1 Tax=Mycteria americana TaxID=33587 RepID=A0AAN7MVS8_MYCAM|nr:hypothetical protein QYF61_017777 [Mycteria americana]